MTISAALIFTTMFLAARPARASRNHKPTLLRSITRPWALQSRPAHQSCPLGGAAGVADEQKRALLTRASAHTSGVQEAVETERLSIIQARGYATLQCVSHLGCAKCNFSKLLDVRYAPG